MAKLDRRYDLIVSTPRRGSVGISASPNSRRQPKSLPFYNRRGDSGMRRTGRPIDTVPSTQPGPISSNLPSPISSTQPSPPTNDSPVTADESQFPQQEQQPFQSVHAATMGSLAQTAQGPTQVPTPAEESAHLDRPLAAPPDEWRMPDAWWHGLPQSIIKRLGTETLGPQRAIIEEGQMLLVLHRLPSDKRKRQGVYLWMRDDDDWQVYREGEQFSPTEDGEVGLRQHLEEYEESVAKLNESVIRARTAAAYLRLSKVVAIQKHAAENLYNALREARAGMIKPSFDPQIRDVETTVIEEDDDDDLTIFQNLRQTCEDSANDLAMDSYLTAPEIPEEKLDKIPYDPILINFRDRAYGIKRDFDLLYEDTRNAIEYREASQAEWLNLLVSIFFPLTILASIIETGVLNTIFERNSELNPLITIACLIIGAFLIGVGLQILIGARRR